MGKVLVVEEVLDDIIRHSLELQKVANSVGGELAKEYLALAEELDSIVAKQDFSRVLPPKKRRIMLNKVIKEGKVAIHLSNKRMGKLVKNRVLELGALESEFAAGSINKAATGKGTISFASSTQTPRQISKIAQGLIIKGAPQAEWWARQSKNLQNKFTDVVRAGWFNQDDIPTISQRIRGTAVAKYKDGIMSVSKNQADSLARTSMASVANQVREETYLANQDVLQGVQFLAVLDNNTSELCKAYSGDKWIFTPSGYKNIEGGHEYRQPPLHFNCRSTMLPLIKDAKDLAKDKLAMVPKKKRDVLGTFIGPKVCRSPCKYQDADVWLEDQPLSYQRNVLGKAFEAWSVGDISFKRLVTQKGRKRTLDELAGLYKEQDLIPKGITDLKTEATFAPYAKAKPKYKKELAETNKGEFLKLEERLMTGQEVSRAESDKFGRILINADPKDLEYKANYHPKDFNEFLGNKGKRLAFYNHTAKKFERMKKWRKGDLSKRKTGPLNSNDSLVLEELKTKIINDDSIIASRKKILLEMFDESNRIVGSQRSLAMLESLLTLARKSDYSDIDSFLGYLSNSTSNAVNSYFGRVKRLEIRLTASSEKEIRYNILSEQAKKLEVQAINAQSDISLASAGHYKNRVTTLGSRRLRDFEGETPSPLNVDLELKPNDAIEFYLANLRDDVRMGSKQAREWANRIRPAKKRTVRMTRSQRRHLERVEYILKRTEPGQPVLLDDTILNNPLFREWRDAAWTGRGFPPAIRKEVGLVLQDAEVYQGVKHYLKDKIKYPDGVDLSDYLAKKIDDYIADVRIPSLARRSAEKEVDRIYDLTGAARRALRDKRAAVAANRLDKSNFFAKLKRKKVNDRKAYNLEKKRASTEANWEGQVDAIYIKQTAKTIDDLIRENGLPGDPFFKEAFIIRKDDIIELSRIVNREGLFAAQKGDSYIDATKRIGRAYYWRLKKLDNPSDNEAIRMGHFLLEGILKEGKIFRKKSRDLVDFNGVKIEKFTWRLEVGDKKWQEMMLANKKNYDVEGLPTVGKAPKLSKDGIWQDTGMAAIRTNDKDWVKEVSKKSSSKPWKKNLEVEAGTGIKVNGYIYDVMSELEKKGRKAIPPRPGRNAPDEVKTKYESYKRARTLAKGLRDDTFYNRMSNDRYARTYADTVALHWQGDDINRGLMKFANGRRLGKHGLDDFSRNFMNVAGYDKIPMKTRIALFSKIPDDLILKTVENPTKYDWWFTTNNWIESGFFKNLNGLDARDIKDIKKLAEKADPSGDGAFQFLAMLKERSDMIKWTRKGNKIEDFVSHLPSQRDGTTNVLQHFAGISRDQDIAKAVNMVKQRGVADAYIQLRDALDVIGKRMPTSDPLKKYIDIPGLTHAKRRKSVKKSLMTSNYNAQAPTLGKSYFEALESVQVNGKYIFRDAPKRDVDAIGNIILKASEEAFPEATKVRYLLNNFAEAHEIARKSEIELKTPIGFPFKQSYRKTTTTPVELRTSNGGKVIIHAQVEIAEDAAALKKAEAYLRKLQDKRADIIAKMKRDGRTDRLISKLSVVRNNIKQAQYDVRDVSHMNWPKQNRAFAPNIIHAMDSTHKSLVALNMERKYGITDFSMIHDSFGTHFGNMDLLLKETKEAFLEMYKGKNFMEFLYDEFSKQGVAMKRFVRNEKGLKVRSKDGEFLTEAIPLRGN